jgi:hypothetical protein
MKKIIKIGLALLFIGCLLDMPYGYFQFVRFIGMIGFVVLAYIEKVKGKQEFFIFLILSAILINPFFKIHLGRLIWNIIDIIWALILIISVIIEFNNKLPKFKND